jgi:type II secretory pathway pseudopilin PulG
MQLKRKQVGFTYIMIMVAAMIVGISAGMGVTLVSREVRADRENELLFRGSAYREAIRRYYQAGQINSYPRSLDALLMDPRFPGRRYLRDLYPDPMGGKKGEWQLIRGIDGGIIGVASRSKEQPVKKANFPEGYENFADAKTYGEWIFNYLPQTITNRQPFIPKK